MRLVAHTKVWIGCGYYGNIPDGVDPAESLDPIIYLSPGDELDIDSIQVKEHCILIHVPGTGTTGCHYSLYPFLFGAGSWEIKP